MIDVPRIAWCRLQMFVVKQCGGAFNFWKVVILRLLSFFLFSPSWVRFLVFLAFFKKIVYVLNINIFAFIEEASTKLDVLINIVSKSFSHARIWLKCRRNLCLRNRNSRSDYFFPKTADDRNGIFTKSDYLDAHKYLSHIFLYI